jgi:hydroxymethylbilane synthase
VVVAAKVFGIVNDLLFSMTTPLTPTELRIATRTSPLAMAQTQQVVQALQYHHPWLHITLLPLVTQGDKRLEQPLHQLGDKGLFTKELEQAMLNDQADVAIHSAKDLPTQLPDGFMALPIMQRANPADVLLGSTPWHQLAAGAVVGSSSLRRVAQLQRFRPDLVYLPIRGNLNTRWQKLQQGHCQALVLAAAGVERLGWTERIVTTFDPANTVIPAVGQGILAAEYCKPWVQQVLLPLVIPEVQHAWLAERALMRTLEGGCHIPLGGYAHNQQLQAIWFPPGLADTHSGFKATVPLPANVDPLVAGEQLAQHLQQLATGKGNP